MFFENEITNYYKNNFEIIDYNQYIVYTLIIWTICKFLFYVVPVLVFFRGHDHEQLVNRNINISIVRKISRNIIIFSLLIPLLDCFVFFYIVTGLVGRVESLYPRTTVRCQLYGISAGILNVVLISNFQNLTMFSSGVIFTNQTQFFLAFNFSVFSAWCILSASHLFYLYSLNAEIIQKLQNPDIFSGYNNDRPFTADHIMRNFEDLSEDSRVNRSSFVGPIEDRLAIRELLDGYGDSIVRRDQALWSACWGLNSRWQPGNEIILGRDAITSYWKDLLTSGRGSKGTYTRAYSSTLGALYVNGDTGEGWSYTNELLVDDNNMTYHLSGMYSDRYVREHGQWLFEERSFKKLHIDRPY